VVLYNRWSKKQKPLTTVGYLRTPEISPLKYRIPVDPANRVSPHHRAMMHLHLHPFGLECNG